MELFNRLPLTAQAVLVLIVPMMGLIWFTHHDMVNANRLSQSSAQQFVFSELGAEVGAILNATQKERGMSAGYLSSQGTRFGDALIEQRAERDRLLAELKTRISLVEVSVLPEGFQRQLKKATNLTHIIRGERDRVDRLASTPADTLNEYSIVTRAYLDLIAAVPHLAQSAELARQGAAYSALAEAKELAGKERAVLSSAFARDRFNPGEADVFRDLAVSQRAFLATSTATGQRRVDQGLERQPQQRRGQGDGELPECGDGTCRQRRLRRRSGGLV